MNTIVLEIDDPEKEVLLLALLAELDFVRVQKSINATKTDVAETVSDESEEDMAVTDKPASESEGSIFNAVGIWAGREISGKQLRATAWER